MININAKLLTAPLILKKVCLLQNKLPCKIFLKSQVFELHALVKLVVTKQQRTYNQEKKTIFTKNISALSVSRRNIVQRKVALKVT